MPLPPLIVGLIVALCWIASASTARADADSKAAARDHFQKGVAAFDERRFAEAAEHFEAAYRLSPAYVVLYNIGQVHVVLGRSVEAVDAFDKYLKQGASSVSPERRQEVQAEIEKQLARIGTIAVRTTPDGADVRVDGAPAGKSPLGKPVRVTAGRHIVAATLTGHAPIVREVDVTGRAELALELVLEAKDTPAGAATPEPPPAPQAPPVTPVVEMPVVEKTIIERTYVETPSSNRPAAAVEQRPHGQPTAAIVQRVIGYLAIAGGLATATTGGIIAYRGSNQSDDARTRLAVPGLTDAEWEAALADFNAGKDKNQQGWIVAGVGTAVLLGGIIVLATVPDRTNTVSVAPWVTAGAGGLAMNTAW